MILLISTCSEKLHEFEFVKPVGKVIGKCLVKHCSEVSEKDLKKTEKVIICGTGLQDFKYLENLEQFELLKSFDKPVLGICSGAQIIGLIFGGKLKDSVKIGPERIELKESIFGFEKGEIYFLHNKSIELPEDFEIFGEEVFRKNNFYGLMFHPEVLNREVIEEFISLR